MNGAVTSYANVLLTLAKTSADVADAQTTFQNCPQLTDALSNPTIPEAEKFAVIDRIFPASLRTFLKVVCQNGQIDSVLEYVTPLTEAQLAAMKKMICAKTGEPEVQLELKQNPALLGGFVLHIGDDEYDRSMRASIRNMRKSLIRR